MPAEEERRVCGGDAVALRWREPSLRFIGEGASGRKEEGAVAVLLRGHVWWWSDRRRWCGHHLVLHVALILEFVMYEVQL